MDEVVAAVLLMICGTCKGERNVNMVEIRIDSDGQIRPIKTSRKEECNKCYGRGLLIATNILFLFSPQ